LGFYPVFVQKVRFVDSGSFAHAAHIPAVCYSRILQQHDLHAWTSRTGALSAPLGDEETADGDGDR
jgi:hypothetical protein